MATNRKKKKRFSSWARHWQRLTPSGLVAIVVPVRGATGAPVDATYIYAVSASDRHGTSPMVVLPPVKVAKGEAVFLVPGRSEAGNELGYTLYRSALNGDKRTLRAIGHVDPINSGHRKTGTKRSSMGYYRDDFAPLESRVYVLQRGRMCEIGK
jgi:hypothetical protein